LDDIKKKMINKIKDKRKENLKESLISNETLYLLLETIKKKEDLNKGNTFTMNIQLK
jgi:hypothetical protein